MTSRAFSPDAAAPSGRPVLVLSGPEDPLVLVLAREGEAVASVSVDASGRAMPVLAPSAMRLLSDNGLAASDLGGVACVRGPGSFTGLRSVLAFGTGIALGAGLPMAGIDYLPVLALGALGEPGGRLFVATYSRSAQVYLQEFAAPSGTGGTGAKDVKAVKAAGPPEALSLETARTRLLAAAKEGLITLAGGAAGVFGQALTEGLPEAAVLPARYASPDPRALALFAHEAVWSPEPPVPLYIRPSDAEENLAAIAVSRGISPKGADRLFHELTTRPAT